MTLRPQKAQESTEQRKGAKAKKKHQGKPQKQVRRKAPPFTLVWSEEVLALRDFSSKQIIELRTKALWRIGLAEAALNGDPAVATLGRQAHAGDVVWSKFQVGKYWFCLDFRAAHIREYVVKLAPPSSHDDTPGSQSNGADGDARAADVGQRASGRLSGAFAELGAGLPRAVAIWRLTQRRLSRAAAACAARVRSRFLRALAVARRELRNASYIRLSGVLDRALGALRAWVTLAIASWRISFTRLQAPSIQQACTEAQLEPRCVGQNSGMHILLYSWVRDEQQPIDWSADLFGVDWAANLFGALPEEERAFT